MAVMAVMEVMEVMAVMEVQTLDLRSHAVYLLIHRHYLGSGERVRRGRAYVAAGDSKRGFLSEQERARER
jgi:hypothetical protein